MRACGGPASADAISASAKQPAATSWPDMDIQVSSSHAMSEVPGEDVPASVLAGRGSTVRDRVDGMSMYGVGK